MSYFKNITTAVSTLIDGMKVTIGYFIRPREYVTLQYPDEVWPVPSRNIGVGDIDAYNTIRAKLTVNMDDCIGCKQCERACPVSCITIDTIKGKKGEDLGTTSNGTTKRLVVTNFTIDMSECMYCDLCTHPCPETCITMTPDYQFISNDNVKTDVTPEQRWRDKDLLIYQFATVSQEEIDRRKAAAEAAKAEKEALMAAKAEKAAKLAAEKAEAEKVSAERTSPSEPVQEVVPARAEQETAVPAAEGEKSAPAADLSGVQDIEPESGDKPDPETSAAMTEESGAEERDQSSLSDADADLENTTSPETETTEQPSMTSSEKEEENQHG